ncbi:30S ribosomal protein S9, partial [Candidatus Uhrbacteria bacterium]|nr:30S ribosomal protein S9 [Candidatus Uhrbacteria bacterium]
MTTKKTKEEIPETPVTPEVPVSAVPFADRKNYLYGVGGRKTAIAQVRLFKNGTGIVYVNGKLVTEYFPYFEFNAIARSPLDRVGQADKLDVSARVKGGG